MLESCEDVVEQLLNRMASVLPNSKDRLIFLINNYHLTINIIDVTFPLFLFVSYELFKERVVQDSRIHSIIHELEQKTIGEFVEVHIFYLFLYYYLLCSIYDHFTSICVIYAFSGNVDASFHAVDNFCNRM